MVILASLQKNDKRLIGERCNNKTSTCSNYLKTETKKEAKNSAITQEQVTTHSPRLERQPVVEKISQDNLLQGSSKEKWISNVTKNRIM